MWEGGSNGIPLVVGVSQSVCAGGFFGNDGFDVFEMEFLVKDDCEFLHFWSSLMVSIFKWGFERFKEFSSLYSS